MIVPLEDPQLHKFEQYERLLNWNLPHHARGDFDGDGEEDLITFTGCAFLSSAVPDEIPESHLCQASGIANMFIENEDRRVGQKYIETEDSDLGFGLFSDGTPIQHSYLGKNEGENWRIYVLAQWRLQVSEIGSDGVLREIDATLANQIDEILYLISTLFVPLALLLMPLQFLFSLLFDPFKTATTIFPVYELITLMIVSTIFFVLWRRNL